MSISFDTLTKLAKLAKIRLMMQTVTIHDAKTNLSKYIAAVKKGKQIFIGGFGKPEVKLVLVTAEDVSKADTRDFSIAKNKVAEQVDSFSDQTELLVKDLLTGAK